LRTIFEPKGDKVIGGWRQLHIEELHNLYSPPSDEVEEDEMGKACSTHGAKRNAYSVLVGKPEGKGPLGRPRYRWEDNIKMNPREMRWM
jgi:hypothetical protein